MRKLHKALIAGGMSMAVLVPGGVALAADSSPTPAASCSPQQRAERWAYRDQVRTQILDQLKQEGVTDPAQVQEQLRTRLHDAMGAKFGEVNGRAAGNQGAVRGGGMNYRWSTGDRPMDGTGNRWGANQS
jgi:hypothetical protein